MNVLCIWATASHSGGVGGAVRVLLSWLHLILYFQTQHSSAFVPRLLKAILNFAVKMCCSFHMFMVLRPGDTTCSLWVLQKLLLKENVTVFIGIN